MPGQGALGHFRCCVSGQRDQDHKMSGMCCHCHQIEYSFAHGWLFERFQGSAGPADRLKFARAGSGQGALVWEFQVFMIARDSGGHRKRKSRKKDGRCRKITRAYPMLDGCKLLGKNPRRMGKTLVACASLALWPMVGSGLQCARSSYRKRACQTFLNRRGRSSGSDAPVISSVRCSAQPPPPCTPFPPYCRR